MIRILTGNGIGLRRLARWLTSWRPESVEQVMTAHPNARPTAAGIYLPRHLNPKISSFPGVF